MRRSRRKRLGQHYLVDSLVIDEIHRVLAAGPNDRVVEIGPGLGALTDGLVESGCALTLVEIDRSHASVLSNKYPSVDVICDDVLNLSSQVFSERRVIGNLPYSISTPLISKMADPRVRPDDMYFMLQKEVADRVAGHCGSSDWGRLSVMTQWLYEVHKVFDVGPESFDPPPQVESSLVAFAPRAQPLPVLDISELRSVLRVAFSQRRKSVSNSLKSLTTDWASLSIDPACRPDELGVEEYVAIANSTSQSG